MVLSSHHRTHVYDLTLNAPLTMDPKGRVTLPTRVYNVLTERSLVWTPFENHLRGYTPSTWKERVVTPLLGEDSFDHAVAERQRRRLGLACDLIVDEHGRFILPPLLRERAGLARDCVIVSLMDRLELWDSARWNAWVEGE